jgi:hypothetical protein
MVVVIVGAIVTVCQTARVQAGAKWTQNGPSEVLTSVRCSLELIWWLSIRMKNHSSINEAKHFSFTGTMYCTVLE